MPGHRLFADPWPPQWHALASCRAEEHGVAGSFPDRHLRSPHNHNPGSRRSPRRNCAMITTVSNYLAGSCKIETIIGNSRTGVSSPRQFISLPYEFDKFSPVRTGRRANKTKRPDEASSLHPLLAELALTARRRHACDAALSIPPRPAQIARRSDKIPSYFGAMLLAADWTLAMALSTGLKASLARLA